MSWTLLVAVIGVSVSCSAPATDVTRSGSSRASVTPTSSPRDTKGGVRSRELRSGATKGALQDNGLTATVEYTPNVPVARWTASGPKSVKVSLSAFNKSEPGQDIYLAKVTTTFYVDNGLVESAIDRPTVDAATVQPGYLVAFPATYVQSLDVPDLQRDARTLTITFTYELLSRTGDRPKEYTKQTFNDTVVARLSF